MSDETEAAADAPAAPIEPTGTALVVERWFNAHIATIPLPHIADAVNAIHSALPALVAALE